MSDPVTLRQYFANRSELEEPPLLHAKLAQIKSSLSQEKEDLLHEAIARLEDELDLIELRLKRTVLQMHTRDKDTNYYNQLTRQTETEI